MQVPRTTRRLFGVFLIAVICLHTQNSHAQESLLSAITQIAPTIARLLTLPFGFLEFVIKSVDHELEQPADKNPEEGEEYDFIIVGAGSAGAVVANRLTEIYKPAAIHATEVLNPAYPYLSEYFNERKGPFTVPGGCEALGFINVRNSQDNGWPDMELLFAGSSFATDVGARKGFGMTDSLWNQSYGKINDHHTWTIFFYIIKPKSMRRFGSKLWEVHLPGCKCHEYDSDDYWECAFRTLTFNLFDYTGTVKMGPKGDPTAVVNPRLQVYGVEGLRVCDGSIFPEIITGHPNLPIMMISEKLSDMVKEDWGYATGKQWKTDKSIE